jgi:hypothetical protein
MAKTDDGGPAFPHMKRPRPDLGAGVTETFTDGGMSLRDWFAGQAILARWGNGEPMSYEDAAHIAYQMADAMLEARKVQP